MAERQQPSLLVRGDHPLIGIIQPENGQEVTRYFADEAAADAALSRDDIQAALAAIGSASDLDFDEMLDGFGEQEETIMQPDMRMLREMQTRMAQIQQQLGQEMVTGSAGGGAVTCQVSGLQEVKSISIAPEAVDASDLSMLEDLVVLAVNDGLSKAKALSAQRLGALTGGLGLPGLV